LQLIRMAKSKYFHFVWILLVIYVQHNCSAQYYDYEGPPCVYHSTLFFYKAFGCETRNETINGTVCEVPTNCPTECWDENYDIPRQEDSGHWYEWVDIATRTRQKCECVSPHGVLWFLPWVNDGGAIPYPPMRHCLLVGCDRWDIDFTKDPPTETRIFTQPGEKYERENGQICKCVSGSDPWLADAYTLYHFRCKYPKCMFKSNPLCPDENKIVHTGDETPSCCGCNRMLIDPKTKEPAYPSDVLANGYCSVPGCVKSEYNCTDRYGRSLPYVFPIF
ncbi:unnamed protein product, partial [Owenia fusiformis]